MIAFALHPSCPFVMLAIFLLLLNWVRGKSGRGGKFGQKIRESDWHAWHDEVLRRQRKIWKLEDELTKLEQQEPER